MKSQERIIIKERVLSVALVVLSSSSNSSFRMGQSPQFGTKRYGVTWKSLLFSECFYQKKLLHVFSNMVMEYKNIAGQAPTLLLNPGARVKVLDMSRRNVFSIALIYAWFLFFFFIFKLLLTLLDMILCKEQHFQIYYTMQ